MSFLWLMGVSLLPDSARSAEPHATRAPVRITVVYNNVPHAPALQTAWGFAAVIETGDAKVLFDTGGDGVILIDNLRRLGIDPKSIDAVVLSHAHGDHTGGLAGLLALHSDVTVYLPRSSPTALRRAVERHGARIATIDGPQRLFGSVHSTGTIGDKTKEQALIVETAAGLVVITGCAHPGIVEIARAAKAYLAKDIHLLMGGFHLLAQRPASTHATIAALRELGVHKVAPSHCTGDAATASFRAFWGDDFVEGGCGAIIHVPQGGTSP